MSRTSISNDAINLKRVLILHLYRTMNVRSIEICVGAVVDANDDEKQ